MTIHRTAATDGRCRPIPEDARERLPRMLISEAVAHYGVSKSVVKRWATQLGVQFRTLTRDECAAFGAMRAPLPERKRCFACGDTKAREAFYIERTARGAPYLRARCRACMAAGRASRPEATAKQPAVHDEPWARELYLQAMRAFDLAHAPVTEEDYA